MLRFKNMGSLQRFCSTHASIQNLIDAHGHLNLRSTFKRGHNDALSEWRQLFVC